MRVKKMIILLVVFIFLVGFIPFEKMVKADEGYGVINTEKGKMYRDTHGNLFPIIVINGKKEVKINEYELAPLEALLERDGKQSKGKSALPEEILKKYYVSKNLFINSDFSTTLPSIVSYNQRYKLWCKEKLGFGPSTIGGAGCFLTSCAMMLATYNLTINGSIVTPLNLNTWLKNNGGFSGDNLIFGAIAKFPGISSIGYFDSFNDAAIAIFYRIVPILRMTPSHFAPLVKTNGERNRKTNWIMNTYSRDYNYDYNNPGYRIYAPYDGKTPYYQTVEESGYDFASSSVFRTAYPQQ
ncbi:MAG: hypothetical protein K6343_04085 [Caldisericaceae bacterium]